MNKYLAAATAACLWVAPWGMSSALAQEAACAGEITAAQDHFASGTFNRGEAMRDIIRLRGCVGTPAILRQLGCQKV